MMYFIRDERVRGVLIQILALVLLFGFLAYMAHNAVLNLAVQDKTFGFDFLGEPAGYDINQTLVDYDSRDTHFRAMIVGVLNTALVAAVGIVLATLMGFTVGILRLSGNFIMGRLAYAFIEFTRNVPVLLHILLWYGIIINSFPHPRRAWELSEGVFLTKRGLFAPQPIPEDGFGIVVALFVIGIVASVLYAGHAKRKQMATGVRPAVLPVVAGLIVVPPLLAYLLLGQPIGFSTPALQGFNFEGGFAISPEFMALVWALALYTSAFIAEVVRAGILSVSKGQHEAAYALGLRPNWTMRLITLPQALRVIIPPLTSQYLNLTKNSSLAIAIGYMDITATIGGISLNQTGKEMECMMIVMGLYLCFSLLISAFMNWYNKHMALVER